MNNSIFRKGLVDHNHAGLIEVAVRDGIFHADEVFACGLLSIYAKELGITMLITRTRDPEVYNNCDLVLDIGGVYDGEKYFDHIQDDASLIQSNGVKHSSFGLIAEAIIGDKRLLNGIYPTLIWPIEVADNRQKKSDVATYIGDSKGSWVTDFNPPALTICNDTPPESEDTLTYDDQMFMEAVRIASDIISRVILREKDLLASEEFVRFAATNETHDNICVMNRFLPAWKKIIVNEFPEIKYVIFPNKTCGYNVVGVPKNATDSSVKVSFPKRLCGLKDFTLSKESGISGGISVHKNGFMGTWNTLDGAIEAAKLSIKESDEK